MSLPRLRAASCAAAAAAAIGYGAYTLSAAPGPDRLERWHAKWASKQTRWHLQQEHPLLVRYRADLFGPQPRHDSPSPKAARSNVLFPLCGASVDLAALALRGYRVVGVEGVEAAVDALLESFGDEVEQAPPSVSGSLRLRTAVAPGEAGSDAPAVLRAVEGDFLHLSPSAADALGLPRFDAAFDRGALVAVLPEDREAYVATLAGLMAPEGRVLLVEHDGFAGPPYEVREADVRELFSPAFAVRPLQREDRMGAEPHWRERGCTRFEEAAYLLTRHRAG